MDHISPIGPISPVHNKSGLVLNLKSGACTSPLEKLFFTAIKTIRRDSMESFAPTERTALKRLPQRGSYDREVVYRILDEGFVCHVGFAVDGQPFVIPTAYGRVGDTLYIHGSAASRSMRGLSGGIPVCVTVTLVDGLVLARSAFHHSINYRSVVILGAATMVE